jgi:hypothetical protein
MQGNTRHAGFVKRLDARVHVRLVFITGLFRFNNVVLADVSESICAVVIWWFISFPFLKDLFSSLVPFQIYALKCLIFSCYSKVTDLNQRVDDWKGIKRDVFGALSFDFLY